MFRRFVVIFAGLLAAPIAVGPARAQTTDAQAWDIGNLRIGESMDQAKAALAGEVPGIAIRENKETYYLRGFSSPLLLLGVTARIGSPSTFAGSDQYDVANDLASQGGIVALRRFVTYAHKDQASVEAMDRALVQKYGKPSLVLRLGNMARRYMWFRNAAPGFPAAKHAKECLDSAQLVILLAQASPYVMSQRGHVERSCGLFLAADVTWGFDKNVFQISYQLVDSERAGRSYDALMKLMHDGAAAAIAKQKAARDAAKPRL